MTESITWYLASSLLGWLTFPLVYRLFPALADRGYTLARVTGLLLWGWIFWILASLGILRNDLSGLLFAFLVLLGINFGLIVDRQRQVQVQISEIAIWLKTNTRLILVGEFLFLLAFVFMAVVRAANPDAVATEKPMELAFINGILRSPVFPPNDPWMSGYSISYYHFGYILTAMLARLTGVSGNVAFNLMLTLVFALAAIGSYGILYNLLSAYLVSHKPQTNDQHSSSAIHGLALLAPFFLLILSNVEGLLEVIHGLRWFWTENAAGFWTWLKSIDARGLFWQPDTTTYNFWTWLNIKDLSAVPIGEGWVPDRFWWWWRASRIVSDFDLLGNFQEVIDEFPFFSFLLGDLHPHVLALPFNMLAIGVALNLFLGGWYGSINFFELHLRTTPRDFFFAALVLGGLAFLNTWDILVAAALIVGAYILTRVRDDGWGWGRVEDAILLGLPLGVTAILLYLPFYLGFSSQAGGLLPNLVNPTRGAHLWVMWGTFLIPLLSFLIYLTRDKETRPHYRKALAWTLGMILFLWIFSWLIGFFAQTREPEFAVQYLASQGQSDAASLFKAAFLRRLSHLGGLLTIASVLWLSLSHIFGSKVDKLQVDSSTSESSNLQPATFSMLLIILASLLVLAPDFVYLRDGFGYRINTVFKFYYQAWQLWSLAAAFGTAVLLRSLRGVSNVLWRIALSFVLVAGLFYPVLGILNKTNNFNPSFELTLDSSAHLERETPEDAAAIRFLQSAPLGVVAEAVGGSYTNYARIATHTGQPSVLGWPWHEFQWRGDRNAQGTREADIKALYEIPDWNIARTIIDRYGIRYIVVGLLERTTYQLSESKFQRNLVVLFQAGNTVVYGVP